MIKEWLVAGIWVILLIAAPTGIGAAGTYWWIFPLVQVDSPWQFVALGVAVLVGLGAMIGAIRAFFAVNR